MSITPTNFKLYHGDCLEIMPTLEAGSVDAIITDIPYGTTACAWDEVLPFVPMWAGIKHVLKPRGVFVTTASQPFTSKLVMSNLEWFKYEWVWDKKRCTGGINARIQPLRAHESVLVFCGGQNKYNPQKTAWNEEQIKRKRKKDFVLKPNKRFIYGECIAPGREKQVKNGRNPDTVIRIAALGSIDPERQANHPTQKPVALYAYLIRTYTDPGDLVLDITCGSGTTGVACAQTGRNFIGIELNEGYFKIAEQRIQTAYMQPVLL